MSGKQPENDSLIGLTVDHGRYEIVKLIGEGGMGRVFQARQTSMNRMVALKVLRAQMGSDPNLSARFQQEARSVSRLRHPNTIIVHDFGHLEDGAPFISMELLGGRSLASILAEEGRLTMGRALHIMEQVCSAVAEAHKLGVIHRDLKPENIQIDQLGHDPDFAKVLDFGIAKIVHGDQEEAEQKTLTLAGAIFGTPHYMSPEQVHGQRVDHRTDIYSLGIILYELLAGKPPFDGASPMAVMMGQASKPAPDIRKAHPELGISDGIAELINDCLVKDREARLASVSAMITRMQDAQFDLGEVTGSHGRYLSSGPLRIADVPRGTVDSGAPVTRIAVSEPSRQTPEHIGQVASLPPPPPKVDFDETIPPPKKSNTLKVLIAIALVAAAGGGVFYALQERSTSVEPAAEVVVDEQPERVEIRGTAVSYEILSEPLGAEVFEGGKSLGRTPLTFSSPEGQPRTLELVLEGRPHQTLNISAKETKRSFEVAIPEKVAPVAAQAWLKLESDPPGAEVFLGDKELGETPFEWKPGVQTQPVELRFVKDGFEPRLKTVNLVNAGAEAVAVSASLEKSPKKGIRPKLPKPPVGTSPKTPDNPKAPDKPPVTHPDKPGVPYEKL